MKQTVHTWVTNGKFEHEQEVLGLARYFEGKKVKIQALDSQEEKRTTLQNDALWAWDTFLANETGYTAKEMHYIMCGEVFGWDNVFIDGEVRSIPVRTTSNLTKAGWQDYIRDYRIVARDNYLVEMPPFGYED